MLLLKSLSGERSINIVLHCIALHCIVSHRTLSYRIVSYRIVSHRIALYCIVFWFLSNISNTRKRVSSDIQTLRNRLKKRGAAEFFLNDFEVFGYLMKHTFECLIWLLK